MNSDYSFYISSDASRQSQDTSVGMREENANKKINLAIFYSGRIIGYEECLIPFINMLKNKNKYNIKLFFSLNSFTFDPSTKKEDVIEELKSHFSDTFGDIYTEYYKMPYEFVKIRLDSNVFMDSINMQYRLLSEYYNDKKNMELIEKYEENNNMKFDIICKSRADLIFQSFTDFIKDNENDRILHNKHFMNIYYWGNGQIPPYISSTFLYGTKYVIKKYCEAYDFMLHNNRIFKGKYVVSGETLTTDNILQYPMFKDIPGGGDVQLLSTSEIIDKFENNPNGIIIHYLHDVSYTLFNSRHNNNNYIVNVDNIFQYVSDAPHLHHIAS